ncbi:GntR family transcriptional regulator [Kribbella sp. NBC_01245]|uniref:GntR family transcriptional regulator n=1 Tax=Kribbella sp. NBC_01245 TaxID=2903578 RepID=UPI002E29BE1B|nr:GntR family transcriptional regulator [Kribbella sp. NBC_01245]
MDDAPYLRIAAEIQRRIEAGELRTGDRVPSTRALTAEFGVAMATATKALTALRQQGLVHARPGVGTVVGPEPKALGREVHRRKAEGQLDGVGLNQEQVVRAAMAIADADGLSALSMRRVATELGVSTMALYRYVGGKESLVLRMVDTAFGDFPIPAAVRLNAGVPARRSKAKTKTKTKAKSKTEVESWRPAIEVAARQQWAAYRRYPWLPGAVTLGRPQVLRNLLTHTDVVLRGVAGSGLDATNAMYASITIFGYVRGIAASLETEAQAEQDSGLSADEWADSQYQRMAELMVLDDLAGFRALGMAGGFEFDFDLDQLFEFGLGLVLDGLQTRLERASPLVSRV